MSYGKMGIAPCGHTGEAIVGNYYRCIEGCDEIATKHPEVGPVVIMNPRRGELGHIDNCPCKLCDLRRRVVTVELRSSGGITLVSLPWNGTDKILRWKQDHLHEVLNWRMLDKNGKPVDVGTLETWLEPGHDYELHIDNLLGQFAVSVKKLKQYNPGKVTVTLIHNGKPVQFVPIPATIP